MTQSHSKSSSSVAPSAINYEHLKILIKVILHNIGGGEGSLLFSVKFYPFCGRSQLCFCPVHMAYSRAFPSIWFDLV